MARNSATFMRELDEASGSSEEELVSATETPQWGRKRAAFVAVAGVLCLAGACAFAVKAVSLMPQQHLRARQPVTVRALLESQELAELATDNVMALGGQRIADRVSRGDVREAVGRRLMDISDEIKERFPEDHKKLDLIQLNGDEKDAVMKVVGHYGDERMVTLSNIMADSVEETLQSSGDEAALHRRLTEKLRPHLNELQRLGEVLFPSSDGEGIAVNFDDAPKNSGFNKWHVQVGMSSPETGRVSTGRRLSADDLSAGVNVQAQSLFGTIRKLKGDEMPSAPERMLTTTTTDKQSFMDCMMAAMSAMNPMKCMSCMAAHMQSVFKMISSMMMGGR